MDMTTSSDRIDYQSLLKMSVIIDAPGIIKQ